MSSLRSPGVPAPISRPPPVPVFPSRSDPLQNGENHTYTNGLVNHSNNAARPFTGNTANAGYNNSGGHTLIMNGDRATMNGGEAGRGGRFVNGAMGHSGVNGHNSVSNVNHPNGRSDINNNNNRPLNPTKARRAELRAFLKAPQDNFFCTLCRQGFNSQEDEVRHKKSDDHNLQYMKVNYAQQRDQLQKDKCLVTVKAEPERLESNGTSTVKGRISVSLDPSARYKVKILSCDPFIQPEGVELLHDALKSRQAIPISPGQTVNIAVRFTTCVPIEVSVPIGLKMCRTDQNVPFHIIREMAFFCSCDDLSPEATMGDGDCDVEFHRGGFGKIEKIYTPPKVRTGTAPELPMPKFTDPFEIPPQLLPIQEQLNTLSSSGESPAMDEFTIECFDEIMKLLKLTVSEENYILKLQMMLYLEEMAKRAQLMSQNIASIRILRRECGGYQVHLPGLPERRPPISIGCRVNVRDSVRSGIVYQGVFTSIEDSTAIFRMDSYFDRMFRSGHKYSLEFEFCRRQFQIMHNAVVGVENKVFAEHNSCLFPQREPLKRQRRVPLMSDADIERINLYDAKVRDNPEQFQAVKSILKGTHRPAPFILFGPPGTGKTSTIAEAIKQIVSHQRGSRVLVCASSNSACDVICDKILDHIDGQLIFRMYSASFQPNKISARIRQTQCHNFANGSVDFPGEDKLLRYRVIVATLLTSWRFAQLSEDFFSHIFIDECGFAMEPEALIPIYTSLGDWSERCERKPSRHLILAGDIQQLGPVLASSMVQSYLSISLMERLMNDADAPYRKPFNSTYIVKLLRNYRSHRNILDVPNRLFYDNELQEYADEKSSHLFVGWKHLVNKQVPLIFHNCVSEEQRDSHSTSYYNLREVETVLHYVNMILNERHRKAVREEEIGVITPYAAQARRIRHLFNRRRLYDVKVGSVEEFQGQERTVIIMSTVRNSKDLLTRDLLQRLGFLKNPKRFNVALTRAKALLICIGNASILKRDRCWAEFIHYVEEHKAWAGVPPENADVMNRFTC